MKEGHIKNQRCSEYSQLKEHQIVSIEIKKRKFVIITILACYHGFSLNCYPNRKMPSKEQHILNEARTLPALSKLKQSGCFAANLNGFPDSKIQKILN